MAAGRFDRELPLPPQGLIPIKGWFDPQDDAVDEARVLFLIVQGEDEDAVIVNGEGTWHRPNGNDGAGRPLGRGLALGAGNGNASAGARPRHRTRGRHQAGHVPRRQGRMAGDRNPHCGALTSASFETLSDARPEL